jgi:flagellar export protein FliJ
MRKFQFRLAKLLEYRHLQEKWAKDEYLVCRAKRIEGENQIEHLKERRALAMRKTYSTLQDRRAQEQFAARLEDDRRAVEAAVAVLAGEEELARVKWLSVRKDAEALEKLKEKDQALWTVEEQRRVQRDLDEWAVTRRAA